MLTVLMLQLGFEFMLAVLMRQLAFEFQFAFKLSFQLVFKIRLHSFLRVFCGDYHRLLASRPLVASINRAPEDWTGSRTLKRNSLLLPRLGDARPSHP